MTERGRTALTRDATRLQIGPSALHWDGDALVVTVSERGCPIPRRIAGTVRIHPAALTGARYTLDQAGRHRWSPIAPVARVEVGLTHPALRWSGPGYLDTNDGDRPTRADPGTTPRVVKTLTDSPFYARSVIETHLRGHTLTAVHESLDMARFAAPWVRAMLPFRVPRSISTGTAHPRGTPAS